MKVRGCSKLADATKKSVATVSVKINRQLSILNGIYLKFCFC